jgi:1,4-dihydroxy-2-naphthoyl-CoA synthase
MTDSQTTDGLRPVPQAPSSHRITGPYEQLLYDDDGPVVRLTLNRPAVRNCLSMQLSDELTHALERVRDSEAPGCWCCGAQEARSARGTTSPRCPAGETPTP